MSKEVKQAEISIVLAIISIILSLFSITYRLISKSEYIKYLEQNQIEQAEEKEVYVNKCKKYEDLLKGNGLLDECECG